MCWVLDADIDLEGGTIKAVGRHATGFQGTLYGNKHVIKNGTVQWETWWQGAHYACGLFHYINGGKVYDLNLDSTLKLTMKTDIDAKVIAHMGGLAAVASSATLVGINSKVNISSTQTGTTNQTYCMIGGIVGHFWQGTNKLIKSNYSGNLYFKATGSSYLGPDDQNHIGGLAGTVSASTTIDQCSATGTYEAVNCGNDIAGAIGRLINAGTITLKVSNVVLNATIKSTNPDPHPAYGTIIGWDSNTNPWNSASSISNVYIIGGGTYLNGTNKSWVLGWTQTACVNYSNVCLPASSGLTVQNGGASVDSATGLAKKGNVANVVSSANSNPAISNNYTLTNAGGITSKNVSSGHIAFIKGAGCA